MNLFHDIKICLATTLLGSVVTGVLENMHDNPATWFVAIPTGLLAISRLFYFWWEKWKRKNRKEDE